MKIIFFIPLFSLFLIACDRFETSPNPLAGTSSTPYECLAEWPLNNLDSPTVTAQADINDLTADRICFPLLASVTDYISVYGSPLVKFASFPKLMDITNGVYISNNRTLEYVNLSHLTTMSGSSFEIRDNPSLTTLEISRHLDGIDFSLENNKLSEATVDSLLAKLDQAGQSNGSLGLFGVNNSEASVAGLVSKASLISKGWVFPINYRVLYYEGALLANHLSTVNKVHVALNNNLTTLDLSDTTSITSGSLDVSNNPNLHSITLSNTLNLDHAYFRYLALTQSSVDHILAQLDASGDTTGELDIWQRYNTLTDSNAHPSAAGIISLNNLINKGWEVPTNVYMMNQTGISNYIYTALPSPIRPVILAASNDYSSMDFSALVKVKKLDVRFNTNLINIDFSNLEEAEEILVGDHPLVSNYDFSALLKTNKLEIRNNDSLTTLTLNSALNCFELIFDANAFTQATVDSILAQADASGLSNGTLHLQGGRSAAPTGGAANVHVQSLLAKGWYIAHN